MSDGYIELFHPQLIYAKKKSFVIGYDCDSKIIMCFVPEYLYQSILNNKNDRIFLKQNFFTQIVTEVRFEAPESNNEYPINNQDATNYNSDTKRYHSIMTEKNKRKRNGLIIIPILILSFIPMIFLFGNDDIFEGCVYLIIWFICNMAMMVVVYMGDKKRIPKEIKLYSCSVKNKHHIVVKQ